MKIAVVGPRAKYWGPERMMILRRMDVFFAALPEDVQIVSGGATGVDSWAEALAKYYGLSFKCFPVTPRDWESMGRSAGLHRNTKIVEYSDMVIAFTNGNGSGHKDTIRKAIAVGKLLAVVTP